LWPIVPPSTLDDTIDARSEAVALTALHKRPDNRYPSMKEMLHDLDDLRAGGGGTVFCHRPIAEPDAYEPQGPVAKGAPIEPPARRRLV